ncbi:MAG TPA: GAF domain-containing protein, partial [Labilithrix sp.]|nr:GAF domain-containing protein [Labilithrix sp.]
QRALSVAAYLGNEFNLRMPALASDVEVWQLGMDLWPALEEQFILPIGEDYKWMRDVEGGAPQARFRFVHDRAQQAAYALVPSEQSAALHLQLGRLMLEQLSEDERREHLFEITDHLNRGLVLVDDAAERLRIAELNLAVARRAKNSSAYEPALSYVEAGLRCLPDTAWATHYDLIFALRLEKGELEYLLARWESSIESLSDMLTHVTNKLHRGRVRSQICVSYRTKNEHRRTLQEGVEALREFGVELPLDATPEDVAREIAATYANYIVGKDIEAYFDLPVMDDPELLVISELIHQLIPAAYFSGSPLSHILVLRMLDVTVRHGVNPLTPLALEFVGTTLSICVNDYATARRFGAVGLRLLDEKYPVKALEATVMTLWGSFIMPFTAPLHHSTEYYLRGYQSGIEHGSYTWAGSSAIGALVCTYWGPSTLHETSELIATLLPSLAKVDKNAPVVLHAFRANIGILRDSASADHFEYSDEHWFNHAAILAHCRENNEFFVLYLDTACRLSLANWFDDRAMAAQFEKQGEAYLAASLGGYLEAAMQFHLALAYLGSCDGSEPERDVTQTAKAEALLERIAARSKTAPTTFDHQRLLVEAELARAKGKLADAAGLYDRAIEEADENDFLQNQAFAAELAARFYLAQGRRRIAAAYLRDAYDVYERWGASAKVTDLRARYGDLLALDARTSRTGDVVDDASKTYRKEPRIATTRTRTLREDGPLDTMTVVKASQALSEEIVLWKLVDRLMRIVIESAGARTGVLLLPSQQGFAVQAFGRVENNRVVVSGGDAEDVPVAMSISQYVARTSESVVLHDASEDPTFRHDVSLQARKVKSVLCVPMVRQGRTIAIVYLENNLLTGAFTPARVATLKVLAGQIAISIENATLYGSLESKVEERTAQLAAATHHLEQLLDNMRQGIVVFRGDGRIVERFSKEAERIFGTSIREGSSIVDVLFAGVPEHDPRRQAFVELLGAGFEQLMGDWALLESALPREVEIHPRTDRAKVLLYEFRPIMEVGGVTRIMVLALDDTERRRLQREAADREAAHSRDVALMKKLLSGGPHLFVGFLRTTEERLDRFIRALRGETRGLAKVEALFQHAHTIKGESRVYELTELETICAEMEAVLAAARAGLRDDDTVADLASEVQSELLSAVGRAHAALEAIRRRLVDASPIGEAVLDQVPVSRRDVERLLAVTSTLDPSSKSPVSTMLKPIVDRLSSRPLGESTAHLVESVPYWAAGRGKQAQLLVEGRDVPIPARLTSTLAGALTHIVRNAIAHGVEAPEDRIVAKKPAVGTISIQARQTDTGPEITVQDDGVGLNMGALRAKGEALGIKVDPGHEWELIFVEGLSTKEFVDDLAGHGAGLGAVRDELRDAGYFVEVETHAGRGTRFTLHPRR